MGNLPEARPGERIHRPTLEDLGRRGVSSSGWHSPGILGLRHGEVGLGDEGTGTWGCRAGPCLDTGRRDLQSHGPVSCVHDALCGDEGVRLLQVEVLGTGLAQGTPSSPPIAPGDSLGQSLGEPVSAKGECGPGSSRRNRRGRGDSDLPPALPRSQTSGPD